MHPKFNTFTNVVVTSLIIEKSAGHGSISSPEVRKESRTLLKGESQQGCAVGQKPRANVGWLTTDKILLLRSFQ